MGPQSYLRESSISHMYKVEIEKTILVILSKNLSAHSKMEEF